MANYREARSSLGASRFRLSRQNGASASTPAATVTCRRGTPYAFPAYNRFQGQDKDPLVITDADLLAPTLLNVPVKIPTFYGLARVRDRLQAALQHPGLTPDPEAVTAMVRFARPSRLSCAADPAGLAWKAPERCDCATWFRTVRADTRLVVA